LIKESATKYIFRSSVTLGEGYTASIDRTSSQAWLNESNLAIYSNISKRIASIVRIFDKELEEPLQVVHYGNVTVKNIFPLKYF
jgi:hypothetical protein